MDEAEGQLIHEASQYSSMSSHTVGSAPSSPSSPDLSTPESPEAPSFPLPQTQIAAYNTFDALQRCLQSGDFSDLTIIHGSRKWNTHKVLVLSQSTVLQAMTNILDLSDHDEEAIQLMIEYLYTSQYNTSNTNAETYLDVHIKLFVLAVDFRIPGLELYASTQYKHALHNLTDSEIYFNSVLKIYDETTSEHPTLRFAVVEAAVIEMGSLLQRPIRERFFQLTSDVPDFHADILTYLLRNPTRPLEIEVPILCETCGPASEEEPYAVEHACRGCGEQKSIRFL
ncbi:hypothetical protein BGZ60DRAFT_436112 [Tricladium varicosporioides]|nr:hypothetical protein BGZ60DRAFT_436112 [Hymenoscyphus varicosporioides]